MNHCVLRELISAYFGVLICSDLFWPVMVNVHLVTFCRTCLVWSCCDPLRLFYRGMYFIYPLLQCTIFKTPAFFTLRPILRGKLARGWQKIYPFAHARRLTAVFLRPPTCSRVLFDHSRSSSRTEEACQSQLMSVNSLNRLEDVKIFSREFFIIYT